MEVSGHPPAPVALVPGKSPWYLLNRRLGESYGWSGCFGEVVNLLSLHAEQNIWTWNGCCIF